MAHLKCKGFQDNEVNLMLKGLCFVHTGGKYLYIYLLRRY